MELRLWIFIFALMQSIYGYAGNCSDCGDGLGGGGGGGGSACIAAQADQLYVDSLNGNNANTGTSWTSAFKDLNIALARANCINTTFNP